MGRPFNAANLVQFSKARTTVRIGDKLERVASTKPARKEQLRFVGPVVASGVVGGPNAKCGCGSGKKYKKCSGCPPIYKAPEVKPDNA